MSEEKKQTIKPVRENRTSLQLIINVVLIALVVLTYTYGWNVTQIDLSKLAAPSDGLKGLVGDLFHPDIVARDRQSYRAYRTYLIPCDAEHQRAGAVGEGISIMPDCGNIGDIVTIAGEGLRPNTSGTIAWRTQQGGTKILAQIETDDNGAFSFTTRVPEAPPGQTVGQHGSEVILRWEEGTLRMSETAKQVLAKMVETIFLALMATTMGVFLAVPISFLAARNVMATTRLGLTIYFLVRLFLNILRSVETLIWALIFIVWVGIGPFAGVLALTLHSVAALGKLYSEAVESINPGPVEAVQATGASRVQTVIYAILPQVMPPFLAFTIYRWDINVRMSTVIGLVGGGGIGFLLIQWINLIQYRQAATAVWAIVVVVATMDYFSAWIRKKVV
ncbi:MAG: phosphonate ABC transporter, permease protein PhnE [Chloroflexi bacterium]|nr:phosphonate ABC transporter, permease protein PhnE [Chloroflexota bacterium]